MFPNEYYDNPYSSVFDSISSKSFNSILLELNIQNLNNAIKKQLLIDVKNRLSKLCAVYFETQMESFLKVSNFVNEKNACTFHDLFVGYLTEEFEFYQKNFPPILKHRIDICIRNWRDECSALLLRFSSCRNELKQTLRSQEGQLDLKFVSLPLGDLHETGAVRLVELSNGEKLIYKPRSLETELAWQHCWDGILGNIFPGMHSAGVVCLHREGYGWMHVEEKEEAQSQFDIEEFYFRGGINLALFWILGTKDMVFSNLVASKNQHKIIDCETLNYPHPVSSSYFFDEFNVLNTGYIPSSKSIIGSKTITSGILPQSEIYTKLHRFYIDNWGYWRYGRTGLRISETDNNLYFQNYFAPPIDFLHFFVSGFRHAIQVLTSPQGHSQLRDAMELLSRSRSRIAVRSTIVYSEFLEMVNATFTEDQFGELCRLFASLPIKFGLNDEQRKWFVKRELECLNTGRIPTFAYTPGFQFEASGLEFCAKNFCTRSSMGFAGLKGLPMSIVERQEELITQSFSSY